MQKNNQEIIQFYSNNSNNVYNFNDIKKVKEILNMKNNTVSLELPYSKKTLPKPDFSFEVNPNFFLDFIGNKNLKMVEFSQFFGLFPNNEEFM